MSDEVQQLFEERKLQWKAVYKKQQLPEYDGNPLIEALPPVLSMGEAYREMSRTQPYDEAERMLSLELRYQALYRLQHFFQPVTDHLTLERKLSSLIRSGYISRNPLDPKQVQMLTGVPVPGLRSTASSLTFMGFSGMGKTTAIERVLSLYPQCILHEHPVNRIQLVWLKLNCPHDGSLKSLCMDFYRKIDDILGTNYYPKYGQRRNTINSMVANMAIVARIHCIGALVIDEIQHLLTAKEKGSEQMMNFFVSLINEIGIPVILIGTMRARTILQQDFRQARRGSGIGDMVWEQMEPDEDWDMLIETMWRYQWTRERVELTEGLKKTLYDESQGIVDIAVKLYSLSQGRAMETERERITPALIKQVAREDLRLVQPMLNALRSGSFSEIEKYEDIMPMDLSSCLQTRQSKIDLRATIQKEKEKQENASKQYESSVTEKAIHALLTMDVEAKVAEKAVVHVLKESGEKNITRVVSLAIDFIEEQKVQKQQRQKTRKQPPQNELKAIVEKGKEHKHSAYESLVEAGYVVEPLHEFTI
ncbi:ATP-binding protein [Tumebacillus sp. ITR2]|uniref:ATP-binding protein n=1 Tax=Tumebacillus amylolyticus TaxID=2801339 RepID=A0ABS1J5N9_9BACL|nr:ATP-binding protein [Tumebacillus amylolyticus]MBL0385552.1 ATP-binding protein [Tumebacillus amylolyticus]